MARSRSRSGGRRTTVEILERTLADLADDLQELGEQAFERLWRGTLTDVAEDANTRLARVFETEIEGGPVDFSRIRPGQKNSSVVNNKASFRSGTDILRSSIRVQRDQANYLRFALGEDDERRPGEVGAAEKFNFIPVADKLRGRQGIEVDAHGNMPRNSLATLARRSQRSSGPRAPYGSKAEGRGGRHDIYFGKSGRKSTMGFWQRNDDQKYDRSPDLLVLAVPRSDYDDTRLQDGWNRSVDDAMKDLPKKLQKRLAHVLAAMSATG